MNITDKLAAALEEICTTVCYCAEPKGLGDVIPKICSYCRGRLRLAEYKQHQRGWPDIKLDDDAMEAFSENYRLNGSLDIFSAQWVIEGYLNYCNDKYREHYHTITTALPAAPKESEG